MTDRVKCYRCTMTFKVQRPWYAESGIGPNKTERFRCPVCLKKFWAGSTNTRVRTGIDPADRHEWGMVVSE